MDNKVITRPMVWKTYIVPLIIIALSFILAGYFIISSISTFLFENMAKNSIAQAENHMSRLSNSISAINVIDQLLEEKLMTANTAILNNRDKLSNNFLKGMARDLGVDEIYWYNPQGEIVYTATKYIGWKATKGHPVHDFMHSDRDVLIEDIRRDTESDRYLKYAYAKVPSGEFVQTGILADNIYELTKDFCTASFIETLVDSENVLAAYFIDAGEDILFCEGEIDREYTLDDMEKEAMEGDRTYYAKKTYNNMDAYEILLPIHVDGTNIGMLIVFYSLEETNRLIKNVSLIVLALLIFVFLSYSYMRVDIGRKNREIEELAYLDSITQLPNRSYFIKFLKKRLKAERWAKKALLIVHCHNLNLIKLIFGHDILNELLLEKADCLRNLRVEGEHLFRYFEGNFFIYIEDYEDREQLIKKSDQILEKLDEVAQSMENSRLITTRIGVLELDESYENVDDVIKHVEITIDRLKRLENESYWIFDEAMHRELILDQIIEKELRRATFDGYDDEFYLVYQPQIDLETNKIIALEALARWNNEELGMVSPLRFIRVAESSQLIVPLGEWILTQACKFMRSLEDRGISGIKVAVNISIVQLLREDFTKQLLKIVEETGIEPENLELEITESNFIGNYEIINRKLDKLRKMGISISLDDFGTGYSSLARLEKLNIDVLKIDKSFIDNIRSSDQEDVLIRSIILLANQLGLRVVAEGVETHEQKEYLAAEACDIVQGYLFSKPVPEKKAVELIEKINLRDMDARP
ncbi:MAG TPA: EAL domain-containing protein [Tepidimicrobium sp.]|nr:EAL domain-containing protein [Tepidimicrobium sp.]